MTSTRELAGDAGSFDVPPTFDVRAYLGRMPWALADGPATPVTVRFQFPESRWVLNQDLGAPVEPARHDGAAVVRFDVRERPAFLRWLLSFGTRLDVLDPPEVAAELETLRGQVARIYS
jgi:hypothetical protein